MQNVAYFDKAAGDFHINECTLVALVCNNNKDSDEKPSDVEVDWSKVAIPSKSWIPVQVGQGCPFQYVHSLKLVTQKQLWLL